MFAFFEQVGGGKYEQYEGGGRRAGFGSGNIFILCVTLSYHIALFAKTCNMLTAPRPLTFLGCICEKGEILCPFV